MSLKGGGFILIVNNANITDIAENIKLQCNWNNGASIFTFDYSSEKSKGYPNGSTVTFSYNGTNIFYGFLFTSKQDTDNYSCVAYDQLRYLKSSNSIMRQIQTLDSFVNDVCFQIGDRIRLGKLDKTEVKLGKYLFDNKTHLDMMYQSIKDNLMLNGYFYTLRDNFGALDLRDTYDLRLPLIIGDGSLATDFEYSRSIDEDTYNYIKVAKDNKEKGLRNTYIAQDSVSIAKWGKLMFYEKVSADLNDAQLAQRSNTILSLKNKESETLSVDCVGDVRVMAGNGVKIEIAKAGLNLWAVVDSVTHYFKKSDYTMKLGLIFGGN